jgi:hypothetical protein
MKRPRSLDEMAKAGGAVQAQQAREDAAEEAKRARERAAQSEASKGTAAYNLSPLRGVYAVTLVIVCILIPIIAMVTAAFFIEVYDSSTDFAPGSPIPKLGSAAGVALIPVLILFLLIFRSRVIARGRTASAEAERWLAGLPFQVNGFFSVVRRRKWLKKAGRAADISDVPTFWNRTEPDVYFDVRVKLHAMSEPPPKDFMSRLLDGFGVPLASSLLDTDGRGFKFAGGSGAYVTTQLVRIIKELLLPLHERYPLSSVSLEGHE